MSPRAPELARAEPAAHSSSPTVIEVDAAGRWFKDRWGRIVYLDRTRVMRRLVKALVDRANASPGSPLTSDELVAICWPHATDLPRATALGRLYMILSRLRAFGMQGVIVHRAGGYLVSPDVRLDVKTTV